MFYVNYINNLLSMGYYNLAFSFFKLYIKILGKNIKNKENLQIILSLVYELIEEDVNYFIELIIKLTTKIEPGQLERFEYLLNIILLKYFAITNNKNIFDSQLRKIEDSSYYDKYNLYLKLSLQLLSYDMKVRRMDDKDNDLENDLKKFKHNTKKNRFNRFYIEANILITVYYQNKARFSEALKYCEKAISKAKKSSNHKLIQKSELEKANIYFKINLYEECKSILTDNLKLIPSNGSSSNKLNYYNLFIKLALYEKRCDSGNWNTNVNNYLMKTLELSIRNINFDNIITVAYMHSINTEFKSKISSNNENRGLLNFNRSMLEKFMKTSNDLLNSYLLFSLTIENGFNIAYLLKKNVEKYIKEIFIIK